MKLTVTKAELIIRGPKNVGLNAVKDTLIRSSIISNGNKQFVLDARNDGDIMQERDGKLVSGYWQIVISGNVDVDDIADARLKVYHAGGKESGELEIQTTHVQYHTDVGVGDNWQQCP